MEIKTPKRAAWTNRQVEDYAIFFFIIIPACFLSLCVLVSAFAGTVWMIKQAF